MKSNVKDKSNGVHQLNSQQCVLSFHTSSKTIALGYLEKISTIIEMQIFKAP